ncbi:MAG: methionine gamma-lyase [Bacteroidia bacterium]|nr:MAG: methionine gamma-lyase [Bacteroidia bacterium]
MSKECEIRGKGFATRAIHAGRLPNQFGALNTPIYQSSTFVFDSAEQGGRRFALEEEGYIYTRLGNPNSTEIEAKLAELEGAEACLSAASGMGAITSALWTSVSAGDHIVAAKTLYGCTFALLNAGLSRFGVEVDFVDARDPQNVKAALKPNTKVVYLETPANPNMYISDIRAIAKLAHEHSADIQVYVDNTYCTPYLQRPFDLGANVVVHSATKYLNGHGDVIAGFVLGKKEFIDQVRFVGMKDMTGATLGPFEAYLIGRGMKTLALRMDRHCASAQKVAEFLESHPKVAKVMYPGLKSFPQHDVAMGQMCQPGAMIAFELQGGIEAGRALINSCRLCIPAVSLGDAETLIQHPASMTHSPYTPEERAASDIAEGLVRLSVGLEDADDIIADLKQALEG